MKKVFCVIAAAAVAAFLILSPAFISKGLGKSIFEVMEEEKTRRYEGNIELWHVVSFKTSAKSGYSFLCERMKTLSKTLPYVYINVSGMTAEEAEQRFLKGERPDVVSYPAGFKLSGELIELDYREFAEPFINFPKNAYPYMADSYVLLINEELFTSAGVSICPGPLMEKSAFLSAYNKFKNALAFTDAAGLDGEYILKNAVFEETFYEESIEELNSSEEIKINACAEDFYSGKTPMLVCPYSEYAAMLKNEKYSSLCVRCFDISKKTDAVQLISAFKSEEDTKNDVLKKICGFTVTNASQKKVLSTGMFPATIIKNEDIERREGYELLFSKDK